MVGMKTSMQASLLLCATLTVFLAQNFAISSTSYEDRKHYYSPDPNSGRPPSAHHSPPHGSSGSGGGSHGSITPPSHGRGGHGSISPPTNCGNPPSGGHYTPRPTPPSGGGGSYYSPPPTTPIYYPPSTPSTPNTPTTPTTPIPPAIFTPPSTPSIVSPPTTPGISTPPPFDPNSPPFTCVFWRNHPTLVWGLLGWWGTVGGVFGGVTAPGFVPSMTVQEALANTRADGLGALYREGTASLLNSMSNNNRFPYTTKQVRDRFIAALRSDNAAAAQARLFKLANEGRLPRA